MHLNTRFRLFVFRVLSGLLSLLMCLLSVLLMLVVTLGDRPLTVTAMLYDVLLKFPLEELQLTPSIALCISVGTLIYAEAAILLLMR